MRLICPLLILLCYQTATASTGTEESHTHDSEPDEEEHKEKEKHHHEDHPDTAIFVGMDISPAISAEATSKLELHLEAEFKLSEKGNLVIAGGIALLFPSSEEGPENTATLGFHFGYMHHLENMEIGGSVGFHLGVPGIEPMFVVGKEFSSRFHVHGGVGVTVGKNSDDEQDVLLGPLMFGLGYRLN